MENSKTWRHSSRDRARIVALGASFAAVFLMLSQVYENTFANAWHERELSAVPHAVANILIFGTRFLLLPAGLMMAIVATWHGLVGKPTRLTRWILRECDKGARRQRPEDLKSNPWSGESRDGRTLLEPPDWCARVVPDWLAWSIVLGGLVVFALYAAVQHVLNR